MSERKREKEREGERMQLGFFGCFLILRILYIRIITLRSIILAIQIVNWD